MKTPNVEIMRRFFVFQKTVPLGQAGTPEQLIISVGGWKRFNKLK